MHFWLSDQNVKIFYKTVLILFLRNNEPTLFSNYAQKQKVAGNSKLNSALTFNTQQQTTVLFYKIWIDWLARALVIHKLGALPHLGYHSSEIKRFLLDQMRHSKMIQNLFCIFFFLEYVNLSPYYLGFLYFLPLIFRAIHIYIFLDTKWACDTSLMKKM